MGGVPEQIKKYLLWGWAGEGAGGGEMEKGGGFFIHVPVMFGEKVEGGKM